MNNRLIQSELKRICSLVANEPSVHDVYLFGSAVDEVNLHRESDIDLCIVQETEHRFFDRLAEWITRIQPKVGLDLVVYTPEEFEELLRDNYFVKVQIVEKGREIYHAA